MVHRGLHVRAQRPVTSHDHLGVHRLAQASECLNGQHRRFAVQHPAHPQHYGPPAWPVPRIGEPLARQALSQHVPDIRSAHPPGGRRRVRIGGEGHRRVAQRLPAPPVQPEQGPRGRRSHYLGGPVTAEIPPVSCGRGLAAADRTVEQRRGQFPEHAAQVQRAPGHMVGYVIVGWPTLDLPQRLVLEPEIPSVDAQSLRQMPEQRRGRLDEAEFDVARIGATHIRAMLRGRENGHLMTQAGQGSSPAPAIPEFAAAARNALERRYQDFHVLPSITARSSDNCGRLPRLP